MMLQKYKFLILGLFILSLLLFKNPFSTRNTISNLEPFPDTLDYLVPALSLVKGQGMNLVREGRSLSSGVAPLYSIVLMPLFLLDKDPRIFYVTNILLALTGAAFFFFALEKIFKNMWLNGIIFLLYVTNYYIYWFPSFAMADNLILTLFNIGLYFLTTEISPKKSFFYGLIGMSFILTKFSALPLTIVFSFLLLFKLISKNKKNYLVPFSSSAIFAFLGFYLYELWHGLNIFSEFHKYSSTVLNKTSSTIYLSPAAYNEGFNTKYFWPNFLQYIGFLFGAKADFLRETALIMPKLLAFCSFVGILYMLTKKDLRFLSTSLLLLIFVPVIFISTFNPVDTRYIYFAIPCLLIGFGLFLTHVEDYSRKLKLTKFFLPMLIILAIIYMVFSAKKLLHQIGTNFAGNQTPWYYESILILNNYFPYKEVPQPIVVTSLPPYLVDFYSNGNYSLLPLSKNQDFRNNMQVVWGPGDYSNLLILYDTYLKNGNKLYIGGFGIINQGIYSADFKKISEKFNVKPVRSGCFDLCNIYSIE